MQNPFNADTLEAWLAAIQDWFLVHVLSWTSGYQIAAILAMLVLARLAAPPLRELHAGFVRRRGLEPVPGTLAGITNRLILPLLWLAFLGLCYYIAHRAGWPAPLLRVGVSLLFAWIVIRFTATLVRNPPLARLIAVTAWTIAALNILKLLGPALELLDSIALHVGDLNLSVLALLKGIVYLAAALWIANFISGLLEDRLVRSQTLTPSLGVLLSKFIRILLITAAFLLAVSTVGIDLTVFAVFGGALGVGLGFGLQKVVSNFISGIILLLDKSIKPGDVIAIGETYGWVNSLHARYVSLDTIDGIEHLIPNEELIINRVENWSYSNKRLRLTVPVGIHYQSDVRLAMRLCMEAAGEVKRVLDEPAPGCILTGFGDSSVDLMVSAWINDPEHGINNVKSDILLGIWDKFHEHGIEIPYPQRDLYLKTPVDIKSSPDSESS